MGFSTDVCQRMMVNPILKAESYVAIDTRYTTNKVGQLKYPFFLTMPSKGD